VCAKLAMTPWACSGPWQQPKRSGTSEPLAATSEMKRPIALDHSP
jgi:hypothetical protein